MLMSADGVGNWIKIGVIWCYRCPAASETAACILYGFVLWAIGNRHLVYVFQYKVTVMKKRLVVACSHRLADDTLHLRKIYF
jgi:hypothetical protein